MIAAENVYHQMLEESNLDYETCFHAMRQYPTYAPIQEKGMTIFWAQTTNSDVCRALSTMGGVPLILESMRNHAQHVNLQRSGCEALRNLCAHSPHNRQMVHQAGGIPILVGMMIRCVDDAVIQRSGCRS